MRLHSTGTMKPLAHTSSVLLSHGSTNDDGLHSVPATAQGSEGLAPAAQRVANPLLAQSTVARAPREQ
jgi:hypothetical protein